MQKKDGAAERNSAQRLKAFFAKVWYVLKLTVKWGYQLRSLVLSIPVFVCAAALAIRNARLLPLQVSAVSIGQNQFLITRGVAVLIPLAVTCICIVLMLCSKKMLYPWLVSVLSLVLPWVIWLASTFSV